MLNDGNAMVVANAAAALMEINTLTGKNYIKFTQENTDKLLFALND